MGVMGLEECPDLLALLNLDRFWKQILRQALVGITDLPGFCLNIIMELSNTPTFGRLRVFPCYERMRASMDTVSFQSLK
jgi:hypothetical protein